MLYVRNTPGAAEGGDLQAVLKLAPGFLLGSALIIVAGFLDGGARASIWILAILVDWSTPSSSARRSSTSTQPISPSGMG